MRGAGLEWGNSAEVGTGEGGLGSLEVEFPFMLMKVGDDSAAADLFVIPCREEGSGEGGPAELSESERTTSVLILRSASKRRGHAAIRRALGKAALKSDSVTGRGRASAVNLTPVPTIPVTSFSPITRTRHQFPILYSLTQQNIQKARTQPPIRATPPLRSPSYSDDGSDQLDDSPPIPTKPLPTLPRVTLTSSISRPPPQTASTVSSAIPTAQPSEDEDDDDAASLSSLSSHPSSEAATASNHTGRYGRPEEEFLSDDESEEEEEDQAQDDDDAFSAGSDDGMDDVDELDDYAPTSKKGPSSYAPAAASATANAGGGVKIKFKLGGGGPSSVSTSNTTTLKPPKRERWNGGGSASSSTAGGKKGKGKSKRRAAEDAFSDASEEEDHYSDASADSSFSSGVRLTARQRAKEMGGPNGMEYQSLPNAVVAKHPVVKLTEAEVALRRSENSRKRKHQSDKRLEDEKTETINRLLKKQVGRQRSKLSTSVVNPNNQSKADGDDGDNTLPQTTVAYIAPPAIPTMVRWTSSIKSGEYKAEFAVPLGMGELVKSAHKGYPGPRPPPKTRRVLSEILPLYYTVAQNLEDHQILGNLNDIKPLTFLSFSALAFIFVLLRRFSSSHPVPAPQQDSSGATKHVNNAIPVAEDAEIQKCATEAHVPDLVARRTTQIANRALCGPFGPGGGKCELAGVRDVGLGTIFALTVSLLFFLPLEVGSLPSDFHRARAGDEGYCGATGNLVLS
ncbi:Ino eighty subunit 2, partial [Phenoliferia sp. Uapishka_3]